MGIFRLLFALTVVIYHSGQFFNYNIANITIAVSSFFVISGFYMALVLDKKYKGKKSTRLFWSNRFLRIYPLYWLALVITIVFVLAKYYFHLGTYDNAIIHYFRYAPPSSSFAYIVNLVNVFFRNLTLIINLDYFRVDNSVPGYLLVPTAWTLQIELLFYLIAPFLFKISKKNFLTLTVFYIAVFFGIVVPFRIIDKTLLYTFLSNLIFFLLGMASYRFLYGYLKAKKLSKKIFLILFIGLIIYLVFYNYIPIFFSASFLNMDNPFYYIILAALMPIFFINTDSSKLNTFLGNLSYPLYILHLFVVKLFSNLTDFTTPSSFRTVLILIVSLVVSLLATKYIEAPINKIRQTKLG